MIEGVINGYYRDGVRREERIQPRGSLAMVGITKPGEVVYKALIWIAAAGVSYGIVQLRGLVESMRMVELQIAKMEAKTDGAPEKIADLFAQVAVLRTEVAKNAIRLEELRR